MAEPLNISTAILNAIITAQAKIVGPLAWEQASLILGIQILPNHSAVLQGKPQRVLKELVSHYEKLFGRGAREVCREAAQPFVTDETKEFLPSILR